MGDMIPCLRVTEESLAAFAHPFDWAPSLSRSPGDEWLFWMDHMFHAEAAAQLGRENAEVLFFNAQNFLDDRSGLEHVLSVGVQSIATACFVIFTYSSARLDRVDD